jgi:hypothetical protein
MNDAPLMPKATAVWLVDNTALSFSQIAEFCKIHELEIQGIADGDVAAGIKGQNPITNNQLTAEEIALGEKNPNHKLKLAAPKVNLPTKTRRGPRYTPVSKRQDRPRAILWLIRNHAELKDAQISRLVGTTKNTIQSVRDGSHWDSRNLTPLDPVGLGLCSQINLDFEVQRASKGLPRGPVEATTTLLSAEDALKKAETINTDFLTGEKTAKVEEEEQNIDADAVFAKLNALKKPRHDSDED